MRTTFEERKLAPPPTGSIVSIGVFDGVHLGHQAIVAANVAAARAAGAEATVITFRRHPKKVLLGLSPRTLTTLEHRLELFQRSGVAHTVALSFTDELRALPASEFTRRLCVEGLGVKSFVLGFDSKFGRGREGTPALLRKLGFDVEVVPEVMIGGRAVSSTAIREAVELGDLDGAAAMLGRPVGVFGRVVRGNELGRQIGFPTANLDLHHELHPPPGVYACRVHRTPEDGGRTTHDGVCNIGYRPTVSAGRPEAPLVEVHLLDFDGDLYGERLELEFVERLRAEKKFANLGELRAQIGRDVESARSLL